MPQICRCCSHPKKDKINEMIVNGVPNRRIAAHFNVKEQSVRRHKMNCLPDHLLASKQIQELTRSDALVERITKLLVEAELLLKELKQKDDLRGAVSSLGELRRITEMIAKIGAELWEKQALNIHKDPAWAEIRTLILNTLKDYPEAKLAVISALEGVVK